MEGEAGRSREKQGEQGPVVRVIVGQTREQQKQIEGQC